MYQIVTKDIKMLDSKAFQNVPKLGFWFENEPSGNPGHTTRGQNSKKFFHVCSVLNQLVHWNIILWSGAGMTYFSWYNTVYQRGGKLPNYHKITQWP
jgi:hypothetical protein